MPVNDFSLLRAKVLEYGGPNAMDHSLRLIGLVRLLAEGRRYDEDVITFCALVHDLGGYPKYTEPGKLHEARSVELLPEYMAPFSFSPAQQSLIKETVASHHSPTVPQSLEAILFRDADALDFLGCIGIARDLMRAGKDQKKALESIIRHRQTLPGLVHEKAARELLEARVAEMDAFLSGLQAEHDALLTEKD